MVLSFIKINKEKL